MTVESSGVCVYKALLFCFRDGIFKPSAMSPEYHHYYQALLAAIHFHENEGKTEIEMIEACFKASLDAWGKIGKLARESSFRDESDEIRFFKEVKPTFGASLEYYTYRYHALLFTPLGDQSELRRFWRWEEKKMQRFFDENQEFRTYMRNGDTRRDKEYFVRYPAAFDGNRPNRDLIHELETDLLSPKDHLVTIIKAYERYAKFIETKLLNHLEA